jgi:hypothetical protein
MKEKNLKMLVDFKIEKNNSNLSSIKTRKNLSVLQKKPSFGQSISTKEFLELKKIMILSSNKAFASENVQIKGADLLTFAYKLLNQGRLSNDIDFAVNKMPEETVFQTKIAGIFENLNAKGYKPFEINFPKTAVNEFAINLKTVTFKLNHNDPINYRKFDFFKFDFSEYSYPEQYLMNTRINKQNIKTINPIVFVFDKIGALCSKTKEHAKLIQPQEFYDEISKNSFDNEFFNKNYSRGKFMFDLTVVDKYITKMLGKGNIDINLLKEIFIRKKISLERLEDVKNTYLQHKKTIDSTITPIQETKPLNFDKYFKYTISLINKIQKQLNI